jgi:hypothetical protein
MSEKEVKDRLIYKYWMSNIKRAEKKQPRDDWNAADARLNCDTDDPTKDDRGGDAKPYVNGFRLHYESLKSFLDQTEPTFKVSPTDAFFGDKTVQKEAEADAAYLKFVWNEQKCQITQSKKLDSTLRKNFGATCLIFDVKKWMPGLKYLSAERVIVDPDNNGNIEESNWMGYYEDMPIEDLLSQNPEITQEELKSILGKAKSTLTAEEQKEIEDPMEKRLYTVVRVYHIYARNAEAIRVIDKEGDEEDKIPPKDILEEMNVSTKREYLKFVKGYEKPIKVGPWPYDLDDDEFPITILRFNTPGERTYAYTDYKQMMRLENICEAVLDDIQRDTYWSAARKFTGSDMGATTETNIEAFLMDKKRSYIKNMLDANGKPRIVEIEVAKPNNDLPGKYELLNKERRTASGLGELLATEAREYKDVTALAARIQDANTHQRVNRRLGGPEGYELSIGEDAVKILEIAHQLVPRYSLLELQVPDVSETDEGFKLGDSFSKQLVNMPWPQAMVSITQGTAKLIKLGADAVIGEELAQFWRTTDETPPIVFKLSTKVRVVPGSTRNVTKEQRAATMKQYLLEVFAPMYGAMQRWDLYAQFAERIGHMAGIENVSDLIPKQSETQEFSKKEEKFQDASKVQSLQQGQPQTQAG